MNVVALLTVLLPVVVSAALALVLVLVVVRSRTPPAAPAHPLAPSTWQAQLFGSTYGELALGGGQLAFTPVGSAGPEWVVPCHEVWVRRQGVGPVALGAVRLQGPMGDLSFTVSRERINRFAENSFKTFRESGYADQFVAAAHAQGARAG